MRVLLFHGYLLRGTGSNIYNANLARALAGSATRSTCSARTRGGELAGSTRSGLEATTAVAPTELQPRSGSITATADIGGLLPVYVKDPYEGFEVKTFPELSEDELDRYIDANVAAVRDGRRARRRRRRRARQPPGDGAGDPRPRRARPFAAKIHGSALEYTVKPNPRFLPYAREGMEAAAGRPRRLPPHRRVALGGAADDPGLPEKTRLGPPGVDVEEFAREPGADPVATIRALAAGLREAAAESREATADRTRARPTPSTATRTRPPRRSSSSPPARPTPPA